MWLLSAIVKGCLFVRVISASHPTDTLRDVDELQSGYVGGLHGMDPGVVAGPTFGRLWQTVVNSSDIFLAKPLVYTPGAAKDSSKQTVLIFSELNNIYILNASTGAVITQRYLGLPFTAGDSACADISPYIGTTGTPLIDDSTGTVYFWQKTYLNGVRPGIKSNGYNENGRYRFWALDATTLATRSGYPLDPQGRAPDNNPNINFNAGTALQRTALILKKGVVYAGFGGNCDTQTYYGYIIGVKVSTATIISMWVPESGPQYGIGGGIWQSGGGISSDGTDNLFICVGNGGGRELAPKVVRSSTSPPGTLGESVVKLHINDDGTLTATNFFTPYDYANLDAGDKDFGSTHFSLLDPNAFKTSAGSSIGFVAGKGAEAYFLDSNNLGGYRAGTGGSNGVLQEFAVSNAVFAAIGSYPLDGGYAYITPVGYPTSAYQYVQSSGRFSLAGKTPESAAGRPGTGAATTTSLNGQANTGLLWMTDVDNGALRVYNAIPSNNNLTLIRLIAGPMGKYQRPVFGDKKVFIAGGQGQISAYGAPVNLPLQCNALDFGAVSVGKSSTQVMNCTVVVNTNINAINSTNPVFSISTLVANSLIGKNLVAGQSVMLPVTFSPVYKQTDPNTQVSYGITTPGAVAASIQFYTTKGAVPANSQPYANVAPVTVRGIAQSAAPFMNVVPSNINVGGIINNPNNTASENTLSGTTVLTNIGVGNLTITGLAYSVTQAENDDDDDAPAALTNYTASPFANNWSVKNLPKFGDVVVASQQITIEFDLVPDHVANYQIQFFIYSDGGIAQVGVSGASNDPPIADLAIQQWNSSGVFVGNTSTMDFGPVTANGSGTSFLKLSLSNLGLSLLTVTKSKPPGAGAISVLGYPLSEGDGIEPNSTELATVVFAPPIMPLNSPPQAYAAEWVLNADDLNFGVHTIQLIGTAVQNNTGPLLKNGTSQYRYLGCFDQRNKQIIPRTSMTTDTKYMDNNICQNTCYFRGFKFAGTNYGSECFCSNTLELTYANYELDDTFCGTQCAGNPAQYCGGFNNRISIYADVTQFAVGSNSTVPQSQAAPGRGGPPAAIGMYSYIGCWRDDKANPKMPQYQTAVAQANQTLETCVSYCGGRGFTYIGVEYGGECRCANVLNGVTIATETDCVLPCNGNAQEPCGAGSRLTMYSFQGAVPAGSSSSSTTQTGTTTGSSSTGVGVTTSTSSTGSTTSPVNAPKSTALVYLGCYYDSVDSRTFSNAMPIDSNTVENCANMCNSAGYQYSGTEYSTECYCSSTAPSSALTNTCTMSCQGDSTEICGGSNGLSVYNTTAYIPRYPFHSNASVPDGLVVISGFASIGCFSDGSPRGLKNGVPVPGGGLTTESCIASCKAAGYALASTEFANECYCDSSFDNSGGAGNPSAKCNMACQGNSSQICGGPLAMNIYEQVSANYSPYAPQSTISSTASTTTSPSSSGTSTFLTSSTSTSSSRSSSNASSTSSTSTTTSSSSSTSTPTSRSSTSTSTSSSTSSSRSSSTFSTSTSTPSSTTEPTTSTSSSTSSSRSPSTPTTPTSNSPSTISTTSTSSPSSISSSTSSTSSSSTPSSSTSSSSTSASSLNTGRSPISTGTSTTTSSSSSSSNRSISSSTASPSSTAVPATPSPDYWVSQGCFVDSTKARTLPLSYFANYTMSVGSCKGYCQNGNYKYAGLENGRECYCANSYSADPSNQCIKPCSGNKTETCGGSSAIQIYYNSMNGNPPLIASPGGISYSNAGCFTDNSTYRTLDRASILRQTSLTLEGCVEFCAGKGFPIAGAELGRECYCGSVLSNYTMLVPDNSCKTRCSGSNVETCGGNLLLNIYNATAIYS